MANIYKFSVRVPAEYDASLAETRRTLGLADLARWRDFYVEAAEPLSTAQQQTLCAALGNGLTEIVTLGQPLTPGREVQVAYKRGIVDNENDSIVALCRLLDIPATAGKVATVYQSADARLAELIAGACLNPNIEELHTAEPAYDTLQPAGFYESMRTFDLRPLDDDGLAELG
ncbi:MAG: hypothetical protein KDA41_11940 [Planctomycetales bacterium]|nr:hypothetical protein [Planctomycetales bacterium]